MVIELARWITGTALLVGPLVAGDQAPAALPLQGGGDPAVLTVGAFGPTNSFGPGGPYSSNSFGPGGAVTRPRVDEGPQYEEVPEEVAEQGYPDYSEQENEGYPSEYGQMPPDWYLYYPQETYGGYTVVRQPPGAFPAGPEGVTVQPVFPPPFPPGFPPPPPPRTPEPPPPGSSPPPHRFPEEVKVIPRNTPTYFLPGGGFSPTSPSVPAGTVTLPPPGPAPNTLSPGGGFSPTSPAVPGGTVFMPNPAATTNSLAPAEGTSPASSATPAGSAPASGRVGPGGPGGGR